MARKELGQEGWVCWSHPPPDPILCEKFDMELLQSASAKQTAQTGVDQLQPLLTWGKDSSNPSLATEYRSHHFSTAAPNGTLSPLGLGPVL